MVRFAEVYQILNDNNYTLPREVALKKIEHCKFVIKVNNSGLKLAYKRVKNIKLSIQAVILSQLAIFINIISILFTNISSHLVVCGIVITIVVSIAIGLFCGALFLMNEKINHHKKEIRNAVSDINAFKIYSGMEFYAIKFKEGK